MHAISTDHTVRLDGTTTTRLLSQICQYYVWERDKDVQAPFEESYEPSTEIVDHQTLITVVARVPREINEFCRWYIDKFKAHPQTWNLWTEQDHKLVWKFIDCCVLNLQGLLIIS